jgi:hypothetical protein
MEGDAIVSEDCINPGEIQEGDLAACADGRAEAAVARHVQRCPACARRVEEMAALQATLTAGLYRHACPSAEQLIAYHHDELGGGAALVVAQHLRQCPHCPRELAGLARRERSGRPGWLQAAVQVVEAALVTPQRTGSSPGQAGMQAATVRGARPRPQVYRAGEVELILSLHASPAQLPRQDLSGLVHVGGQVPETVAGAQVELYRDEGLIAITEVSRRGQFRFDAVEPAGYEISLVWGDREVRLKGVRVG